MKQRRTLRHASKAFAALLALCLVASLTPMSASAEAGAASGTAGASASDVVNAANAANEANAADASNDAGSGATEDGDAANGDDSNNDGSSVDATANGDEGDTASANPSADTDNALATTSEAVPYAEGDIIDQGDMPSVDGAVECKWTLYEDDDPSTDDDGNRHGCLEITPVDGTQGRMGDIGFQNYQPWANVRGQIDSVYIAQGVAATSGSLERAFTGCQSLKSVDLSNLDMTASDISMRETFRSCGALTEFHFESLKSVGNVTTMESMFSNSGLTSIDLSGLNFSSLTNMRTMFSGSSDLGSAYFVGTSLPEVENLQNIFGSCKSLSSVNFTNANLSSVTSIYNMFQSCSALRDATFAGARTGSITNAEAMFRNCSSLVYADLSGLESNGPLTSVGAMFYGCTSLETLDVGGLSCADTVTTCGYIFDGVTNLHTITLGTGWGFVTDIHGATIVLPTHNFSDLLNSTDWVRVGDTSGKTYSSEELADQWDGSTMAGTWTWDWKTGSLAISNTVAGGTSATAQQGFTFIVNMMDSSDCPLAGEYTATTTGEGIATPDERKVSNGGTVTLKAGQTITIEGLRIGAKYTVTETNVPSGYTAAVEVGTGQSAVEDGVGVSGAIPNLDSGGGASKVSFTNTYSATGTWTPTVKVELKDANGQPVASLPSGDQSFTFGLFDSSNNPVTGADGNPVRATNDANGTVTFANIAFTSATDLGIGEHTYYIRQVVRDDNDKYIFDDASVTVKVTVADNDGDGTLTVSATYDGSNTYTFTNWVNHKVALPATGQDGIAVALGAGISILAVSGAVLVCRTRRRIA